MKIIILVVMLLLIYYINTATTIETFTPGFRTFYRPRVRHFRYYLNKLHNDYYINIIHYFRKLGV